jgi:Ca-activated chloride channel homolog
MSFAWPLVLLSLLLLPILLAGYVWAGRRRRRQAVTYSSLALIKVARPARSAWRRHIPAGLLLGALALLAVAGARPQITTDVPVAGASVIVALDVSGSMCSTDVSPNRLTAAQNAVRKFIQSQDKHTRIGLVAFSSFAELTVAPTTNRDDLRKAIDSLTTGRGTTIGSAILKSVDAISAIDSNVAPADPGTGDGANADPNGGTTPTPAPSTRSGSYAPEIVVLLTDGANTRGITPVDAAKVAAARGVRVYPIGFGTNHPAAMVCTADQLGGSSFENFGPGGGFGGGGFGGGGGGAGGGRNFLSADVPTLQQVASLTGGVYFSASDAGQLQDVLGSLPRHVQVQQRHIEVSVGLSALAALLVLLAVGAAVRWSAFPS